MLHQRIFDPSLVPGDVAEPLMAVAQPPRGFLPLELGDGRAKECVTFAVLVPMEEHAGFHVQGDAPQDMVTRRVGELPGARTAERSASSRSNCDQASWEWVTSSIASSFGSTGTWSAFAIQRRPS